MKYWFRILCFLVLSYLCNCELIAQVLHFTDSYFNEGIPFVILDKQDGTQIIRSDLSGNITIQDTAKFKKWAFYHPEYASSKFSIVRSEKSDTIHVIFESIDEHANSTFSDKKSRWIIPNILKNRWKNDPIYHAPFYYESYNKYRLSTTNLTKLKLGFDNMLAKLKLKSLKKYEKDHHLILSETYTRKRYQDKNKNDETLEAIQVAGIESPTLSTVSSQFQSYSIYDPFIKIMAKEYTNPLNKNTLRRYHFETIRMYEREKDTLFIVKASPKSTTLVETIHAYYYINSSDFAIEAAILFPSSEKRNKLRAYKLYQKQGKGAWFPSGFTTILKVSVLKNNIGFVSVTENRFSSILNDTSFSQNDFTELAIKRGNDVGLSSKSILKKQRKIPLSAIDSNTYEFYDTLGNFKYFKNVADFAEKVYFRHIPLRMVDLVFDHTFAYNDYEKLRIGLGAQTNQDLSKIASIGGYGAYGYGDDREKYGGNLSFHPKNKWNWKMGASATNDLQESGRSVFFKDRYQHTTEWQRKLNVSRFDLVKGFNVFMEANPVKYVDVYLGIQHSTANPLYNYTYIDKRNNFVFRELQGKARYAFGLRYFQLNEEKVPLNTFYPIVWFNYTRGFGEGTTGFQYHVFETKLQYSINILGFGKSFFQLNAGQAMGDLPYLKLFNAYGSEGFRSVTHNTFETMGYNEFLSSRFFYAFYSHQFGTLHISARFKPKAEIAFNAGIGGLSNKERHKEIKLKTLEDGYYESGFLLTNLIRINTSVVKINLGTGYYYRFGPNSFDTFGENSVFKFVTQIGF